MKRILAVFGLLFGLLGFAQAEEIRHIVKPGDTLWRIATDHGKDWKKLAQANNIQNPAMIYPGDVIVIKEAQSVASQVAPRVAQAQVAEAEACSPEATPTQVGIASWYGKAFHGKRTASGEAYDMHDFTVAHPTLPHGTRLCITSAVNGKSVTARVNDRGPYKHGRIVDLSRRLAEELGLRDPNGTSELSGPGVGRVALSVIGPSTLTTASVEPRKELVSTGITLAVSMASINIGSILPTLREDELEVFARIKSELNQRFGRDMATLAHMIVYNRRKREQPLVAASVASDTTQP